MQEIVLTGLCCLRDSLCLSLRVIRTWDNRQVPRPFPGLISLRRSGTAAPDLASAAVALEPVDSTLAADLAAEEMCLVGLREAAVGDTPSDVAVGIPLAAIGMGTWSSGSCLPVGTLEEGSPGKRPEVRENYGGSVFHFEREAGCLAYLLLDAIIGGVGPAGDDILFEVYISDGREHTSRKGDYRALPFQTWP